MNMPQIDHVVVLMLENRSFDSLLGRLYPKSAAFDGLAGNETNFVGSAPYQVWTSADAQIDPCVPSPDPAELFDDMTEQIFGPPPLSKTPTMGGFASNYAK